MARPFGRPTGSPAALRRLSASFVLAEINSRSICAASPRIVAVIVDAQFTLGTIYSFSQIIYANGGRAGPESDPAEAQYNLGLMHANGRGVPENDAEAVKWYRLAADQGFARAQHNLGLIYANGTGVPQDDVLAYAWLNLVGEQGNELAIGNKDKLRTRMTATRGHRN